MKQLMRSHIVRYYGLSILFTLVCLTTMGVFFGGVAAVLTTSLLSVVETSLSFDNAIVNATILRKMNAWWRKLFLTVGLLIAVGFMRLLFPIVIVQLTAHLGFFEVGHLAISEPHQYSELLHHAHPVIAMFAGAYLAQIGLDFFFQEHEVTWLAWLERPLKKMGRLDNQASLITLIAVLFMALIAQPGTQVSLFIAGVSAVILYQVVAGVANYFEDKNEEQTEEDETGTDESQKPTIRYLVGRAALTAFLYLEVQDASFSFDGVSGAFAITSSVVFIAVGLAIGAMFVRSMTIDFVENDRLEQFEYLENGAFWAILCLAGLMLTSVFIEIGEVVTGGLTTAIIATAFIHSIIAKQRGNNDEPDGFDEDTGPTAVPLAEKV